MARPTLIMIHGFRGTHHGLALIARHMKDVSVIVPDLPGFGKGEVLSGYDLERYVAWLETFIKEQGLSRPPVLLGHSFGSIICAAYAAKYPQTIDKLILVNPIGAPALEGPRGILSKLAVLYYRIGELLPERIARPWLSSRAIVMVMSTTMAKTKDKQLRRFIHDQHRTYFSRFHSARSVSEGFRTSISHSVRDFAARITVPTLLIAGDKDDITPLEKQQELNEKLPDGQLHVIKDVGHLTHYETPDQVASAVQAFIKLS